MRTKKDEKFKLESVEELLGVVNEESAMDIEISKIQPFRAHPFKVLDDDKMQELIDSISVNGILTPVLVRPLGMDTYEMISGHRRMHVNQKTGEIAGQVGMTPENWNSSIFQMIHNLSDSVIVPIAGMIITFVLCYELISMVTEKNNMHDIDTWMFFKYFFKMWVAVYLVSHTFDITMAVFDLAQYAVNQASGVIAGSTALDIHSVITGIDEKLEVMELSELLVLTLETMIVSFGMKLMAVLITVIVYVRMIEIYLYTSVAPIPFATMSNREWGQIGTNYLKGLFALAFTFLWKYNYSIQR